MRHRRRADDGEGEAGRIAGDFPGVHRLAGARRAGRHGIDEHVVRLELLGECDREADKPGLRRIIGNGGVGVSDPGRNGADEDDSARTPTDHVGDQGLGAPERAGQIGVDDLQPMFVFELPGRAARRVDGGGMNQHVDAAEGLEGCGHHLPGRG